MASDRDVAVVDAILDAYENALDNGFMPVTRGRFRDAIEAALAKVREQERAVAETEKLVADMRRCAEINAAPGYVHMDAPELLRRGAAEIERLSAPVEGMENHEPLSPNDELLVTLTQGRATGPCQADAASWIESLYRDITRLQAEVKRLSAPVEGMETTEEERASLEAFMVEMGHTDDGETFALAQIASRLIRDFARLQAEAARLRDELDTANSRAAEVATGVLHTLRKPNDQTEYERELLIDALQRDLAVANTAREAAETQLAQHKSSIVAEVEAKLGPVVKGLQAEVARLKADLASATAAREAAEGVLRDIAAYDDTGANARLAKTGSYGSFDEPGSVQLARAYLDALLPKTGDTNV